jgi:hypothetical protein
MTCKKWDKSLVDNFFVIIVQRTTNSYVPDNQNVPSAE